MTNRENFAARRAICTVCDSWKGVCLRGHALHAPEGCPLKKFAPLPGADYAPDRQAAQVPTLKPCCGQTTEMPPMTWPEVLRQFALAMVKWAREGFPLASSKQHGERYGKCKACPRFRSYYCEICRCVAFLKTKVATEECPDNPPRWQPISANDPESSE